MPYDPQDTTVPLMVRAHADVIEVPVQASPSPNDLPTSLHLAGGNSGECRKSYHGFAAPAAYVIDSPQGVYANPMFTSTWCRDVMNAPGGSPFVAGLVLAHSEAPPGAPSVLREARALDFGCAGKPDPPKFFFHEKFST